MPVVIADNERQGKRADFSQVHYNYDYPEGLNLDPNGDLHKKLVTEILNRVQESNSAMSQRHPSWAQIDETLTAYIRTDSQENEVKAKDNRKPVSIVVPQTYATLEILLTYMTAALLENPLFRFEGRGPEDQLGAIMLEKVIEQQVYYSKIALALHTLFRDGLAYGLGAGAPIWYEEWGDVTRAVQRPNIWSMLTGRPGPMVKEVSREMLFEGNKLDNIDPYLFLPDPNVPIQRIQDGEYLGWISRTNYMLLLGEESDSAELFNVRYLRALGDARSHYAKSDASGRGTRSSASQSVSSWVTNVVDVIYMYVRIIPREWKLPGSETNRDGKRPEVWMFALAGDNVIIQAKPLGLNHNKIPVVTFAPDYDGYSITPISKLEITAGLQTALDWMFNCYDDQTEILTSRGWINLAETLPDDEVATVDPGTKLMWFEKPSEWFSYDYEGWMVNFQSSRMDICVTPNHNMYVRKRHMGSWDFKPAAFVVADSKSEYKTLGNVRWNGVRPESIVFPAIKPGRDRGAAIRYPEAVVDSMLMAGFLGWFLSEGSICNGAASGSYSIAIKQSKSEHIDDIEGIMEAMPFNVTRTFDAQKGAVQWTITDKRLYKWLKDNCYTEGTTGEFKKIPDIARTWDDFHIGLLFERAMWGDGYWMPGHENLGKYGSRSKQLVDDLQELALRLGYFAHTREDKTPAGLPFYALNISTKETNPSIATRNCFKSWYKGKVYCFENSTHLTVTRRNGKIAIQGQSHVANVRKAINDMLIVDPSMININDLKDPEPGKLIRMRRAVWGRGVENAVKQLAVTDITKNNVGDASLIVDLMKAVSGSVDSVSGVRRKTSERVTAEEVKGDRFGGLSRLEKMAKIASLQTMQDLGMMMASHTQQLMSQDTYVKVVGQWAETLQREYGASIQMNRMAVTPFDILVNYDITVKDGTVPGGNYAEIWAQMLPVMMQDPEVRQTIDVVRVIKHVMRNMGAKNVDQFDRMPGQMAQMGVVPPMQAEVLPDEQVAQELQAGNVVPIGGMA